MAGIQTRSCYLAMGVVFIKGGDWNIGVFHDLSTNRSDTRIEFVGILFVSMCPYVFSVGEVSSASR